MAEKKWDLVLVLTLIIVFSFLFFLAANVVFAYLPPTVALLGPAVVWIAFNFVMIFVFALYVPFSLRIHLPSLVLTLAASVPFAGLFVILREPIPAFAGAGIAFIDALFTSIWEEMTFRGIIVTATEQVYSVRTAMWLQAIMFAALHLNTYFTVQYPLLFIVAYIVFSLVAWWLYTWNQKRNILYPIIFHTFTNFWMYFLYIR